MFDDVAATEAERGARCPGDELVAPADVVMDRAFTVPGTPEAVWPWLVQLGKGRGGWYFTRRAERLVPHRNRAVRAIDPRWQSLAPGDVIPDYGGRQATFTVAVIDPPFTLVYTTTRRASSASWSMILRPGDGNPGTGRAQTRVHLRLRIAPVRYVRLAGTVGAFFDLVTIAGMAAGLRERLRDAAA